jgi:hypothetical protein
MRITFLDSRCRSRKKKLLFSLLYSRFPGKIIVVLFLIFSFPEKNDFHIRQQKRKPMHRSTARSESGVIIFLSATENSQFFVSGW